MKLCVSLLLINRQIKRHVFFFRAISYKDLLITFKSMFKQLKKLKLNIRSAKYNFDGFEKR